MANKRVNYREDQVLRQDDLQDEQSYQIAMRRRHNIAHHQWGIVQGLELRLDADSVTVNPGFAVDGYGRELIVPQALSLDDSIFSQVLGEAASSPDTHYADIWLTYCLKRSLTDNRATSRDLEEALLKITCAAPDIIIDPRYPCEVPSEDHNFTPYGTPPDSAEKEWPVYLGRVSITSDEGGSNYTLEPVSLHYAANIGASVRSTWGGKWLQLGNDEAGDLRRFAIMLPDQLGETKDRFTLNHLGEPAFLGNTRINQNNALKGDNAANLRLQQSLHPQSSGVGLNFKNKITSPPLAAPWQIYYTSVDKVISSQNIAVEQLRIESFNPGEEGDPAKQEVVIGNCPEESAFNAVMTIRSDKKVIVDSNITIEGRLIEGAIPLDFDDERFRDELLSRWTKGITLAGTEVDAYYDVPIFITLLDNAGNDVKESGLESVRLVNGELQISFGLKIKHENLEDKREVPVVGISIEFRDESREIVHTRELRNLPFQPITPLPVDGKNTNVFAANVVATMERVNPMTLTVRVVSIGAAQNRIEKVSNAIIKGDLPYCFYVERNGKNYDVKIKHTGTSNQNDPDNMAIRILAVVSEFYDQNNNLLKHTEVLDISSLPLLIPKEEPEIVSGVIKDEYSGDVLSVRVIAADASAIRMKVEQTEDPNKCT